MSCLLFGCCQPSKRKFNVGFEGLQLAIKHKLSTFVPFTVEVNTAIKSNPEILLFVCYIRIFINIYGILSEIAGHIDLLLEMGFDTEL